MEDYLIVVSVCVVLPIVVVWLCIRAVINRENIRKEIILTALEKDAGMDVEQIVRKLQPKGKLLKEKLLNRLLRGVIFSISGLLFIAVGIWFAVGTAAKDDTVVGFLMAGGNILAVGAAFIVNFFVGKKMLSREIEAEEKQKVNEQK